MRARTRAPLLPDSTQEGTSLEAIDRPGVVLLRVAPRGGALRLRILVGSAYADGRRDARCRRAHARRLRPDALSGDAVDAPPPEDLGDPARCAREPAQDLPCARLWASFHRDLSRAFACPSLRDARAVSTACALSSAGAWRGYCCPSLGETPPVPGAPACASLPLVALTREGRRAVVRGDTTLAWVQQTSGRPTAASQRVRADGADAGCAPMTGQLAFEYTVGPTASALAITTTNAGTDATFDTVLYVGTSCGATLSGARCNDDDARAATAFGPRRLSSYVETETLPAATRIVVVLGGFFSPAGSTSSTDHGAFELTVDEVEFADEGAPCDADARGVRCREGSSCVLPSPGAARGVCRRAGASAGAQCLSTFPPCAMGLQCNVGRCASEAAIGAPCDLTHFCPRDAHCARATIGSEAGVCLRNGSDPGGACGGPSSTSCDAGLECVDAPPFSSGACVRRAPIGGPCDARSRACVMGASCVFANEGSLTGLCALDGSLGALCNYVAPECAPGLTCFNQRGLRSVAVGDACGARAQCPMGSACVHADPTRPTEGVCRAEGALGGPCQLAAVSACGAGLRCSRFDASGTCESTATAGAPCERLRTRCADGLSCVLSAASETVGECHTEGSLGAACRASGAPCDAGLVCTGARGEGGVCARVVAAGGACDPLRDVARCARSRRAG